MPVSNDAVIPLRSIPSALPCLLPPPSHPLQKKTKRGKGSTHRWSNGAHTHPFHTVRSRERAQLRSRTSERSNPNRGSSWMDRRGSRANREPATRLPWEHSDPPNTDRLWSNRRHPPPPPCFRWIQKKISIRRKWTLVGEFPPSSDGRTVRKRVECSPGLFCRWGGFHPVVRFWCWWMTLAAIPVEHDVVDRRRFDRTCGIWIDPRQTPH
mmetsp:Transcript_9447/g.13875  ORF Transcript_9447/g.13875 Transcript_9447/m.13875 type:complete len:210 (+) Transcript_9447:3303-3932(+)